MSTASAGPVLGVDTATGRPGLALVEGDVVLAEIAFHRRVSPSRTLMPSLRFVLEQLGLELGGLAAMAVTVGPGSFTGIRVGLATLRGLAQGSGKPLAGVSTLAALAGSYAGVAPHVAAWLDAGRGEIYAALMRPDSGLGSEQVAAPSSVLASLPAVPILFVGDGAMRHAPLIRARGVAGDAIAGAPPLLAAATARLGREALAAGQPRPARASYLRPPDATRARA